MSELIFRGGTIVTVDDGRRVVAGDVAVRDGVIVAVGGTYTPAGHDYQIVDASGCVVMPGLVQAHVHTCQTLARGKADDRELLDWLHQVVWPYEGALDAAALTAAAELAMAELLLGGPTAILAMATVHHTEAVFAAAERSGIRATIGKAMMDAPDPAIPPGLRESTAASLAESDALADRWHGAADGRLRYAYAPRFAVSCTDELLREVGKRSAASDVGIHTHASENRGEVELVRAMLDDVNGHFFTIDGARVLMTNYVFLVGITGTETTCTECGGSGKVMSRGKEYSCHSCTRGQVFAKKGKNWGQIFEQLLKGPSQE